jgi:hypothetical protein
MLLYREVSWRLWLATAVLLTVGLAGRSEAFWLAAALSAVQIVAFRMREGRFTAFPVQVRIAYTALLLVLPFMRWLFWIPAIGAWAQVLLGYCALARCLSLLPWNGREPLSWSLMRRTFLSRPVKGNVLQGLPATP